MTDSNKKIGFIGAGNMGEAIVAAVIKSKIFAPSDIHISDISQARLDLLCETYGVTPTPDGRKLFATCDVIVLAIKPQQMDQVLVHIAEQENYAVTDRKLVISIAAGIPLRKIENRLYKPLNEKAMANLPIIRVMPNTPALVLSGMAGMSANRFATTDDIKMTRTILEAMGRVIEFEEEDLDAVTALSGSGPAYVFYLVEAMIEAGLALKLKPWDAEILTFTTLEGALKLLEEAKEPPEILRQKVTSPGGTTEAALQVLEHKGVKQSIIEAISAAARRSRELSQTDG